MIGSILKNRYKILREAGSGGMARIYLAEDTVRAEQVAIKVLHPQLNEDPAFIQRFQREAMLAHSLDDPHIVRVLDEGVEGRLHYLVMEYVEGPNLYHLIRKKKGFKWPAALNIMRQLALALEHAHAHGVVHRDIKPQNMILTKAGFLKVLDFGIARMPMLPALTQTGAILGSPQYVSPEQVKGKEVGFASDIYSAGLVFYELLAGHSLFEGESAWSIIGHYMSQKPLPMKLSMAEIPERVQTLLNQMLAWQPDERPQASAVRQEIEALLTPLAEPPVEPGRYRLDFQKMSHKFNQGGWKNVWQLGLAAGAIVLITCLSLLAFGADTQAEAKSRLKSLYEEAHLEIEKGNTAGAMVKLDQIWHEDPNYADVALLRQELAPPAPTVTPEVAVSAASGAVADPLDGTLLQAQEAINQSYWTEAIVALESITISPTSEYHRARGAAVLCEAYLGRGLDQLAEAAAAGPAEKSFIRQALADFEAGAAACPRRTDLRQAAEQAAAYLKALSLAWYEYEKLIQTLRPLVATSPDYMGGQASELLYQAYLRRAHDRQLISEPVAAILADYEAALALQVADPAEAQTRRAKLLQAMAQPPAETTAEVAQASPAPSKTKPEAGANPVKYKQPALMGPPNDTIFAGKFTEVHLEWEPLGPLAADEYYDVTIMHLFAGEPRYLGSRRTQENQIKIGSEVGVGEAANDRFYWWITVRKDGTAPAPGALDLPLSPQSEARTFIWGS